MSGKHSRHCKVSVTMMESIPEKQIRLTARIKVMVTIIMKVGMVRPRTDTVCGKSMYMMKKRAARAGMMMFAIISAMERTKQAKIRNFRL